MNIHVCKCGDFIIVPSDMLSKVCDLKCPDCQKAYLSYGTVTPQDNNNEIFIFHMMNPCDMDNVKEAIVVRQKISLAPS